LEVKTFVEMIDLGTRKRTLLYTHNTVVNVIHASINHDRNLLGTIFEGKKTLM